MQFYNGSFMNEESESVYRITKQNKTYVDNNNINSSGCADSILADGYV